MVVARQLEERCQEADWVVVCRGQSSWKRRCKGETERKAAFGTKWMKV